MRARWSEMLKMSGAGLLAIVVVGVASQVARAQENSESMLTYSKGQAVMPAYEGFHPNADGTIDLWFGYLNQNYREQPDIPVGPNNNISPAIYGPDAGQPTHFLPRNNRWIFSVRVPKDFGDKEVVWTLTSHGKTYKAYATLKPGYLHDDTGMQREYFGEPPVAGNKPPVLTIDGSKQRTTKVGQAASFTAIATDDGKPDPGVIRRTAAQARSALRTSICGEDANPLTCGEPNEGGGTMFLLKGFRMACFVYRGPASAVTFDPPQETVWEDHRGASPWATGYTLPPIPKDNKWMIQTTFQQPGTYVIRCQAHDGLFATNQDVTFTVTP